MISFQAILTDPGGFFTSGIVLAVITFGGMVLSVLGAFYLIDAIRFPRELVRTGKRLAPLYDEIAVAQGNPWEPVWQRPLSVASLWQGVASSVIAAAAFAIVVGVGFRRGESGLLVGAALGLGLGLAIVLRRAIRWIAALPGFGHLSEFIGAALYWLSYLGALAVMAVAGILLFLVMFVLMTVLWLMLLPWLVFVVLVRLVLHRPVRAIALIAPLAAVASTVAEAPELRRKRRLKRALRDPFDDSEDDRVERWVSSRFPDLQQFILGIVIGHLYALVGGPLLGRGFGSGSEAWLAAGVLVAFGFAVERTFEIVVQSLFQDDLTRFVDVGPETLAGLRVGLLTGLTLGTIGGLVTSSGTLLHAVTHFVHGFALADAAVIVTSGMTAALLWLLPNALGYATAGFVDWLTTTIRHLRFGLGVAGGAFLLAGVGLQLVQYSVMTH